MESHDLYEAAKDAIGAKKCRSALNMSLKHFYRLCQPLMDDDPEADGARSDVDRIEQLVDVMAAHPHARPALTLWRLYFASMFDRALDRDEPAPISDVELAHRLGGVVREFGEFLESCDASDLDTRRMHEEGAEAVAAIERLIRAASAGVKPTEGAAVKAVG